MDEYRMARSKWMAGETDFGWMDVVNVAMGRMPVEAARKCPKDRIEWRALVHM